MARRKKKNNKFLIPLFLIIAIIVYNSYYEEINNFFQSFSYPVSYNINEIPEYNGENYVVINNNEPNFKDSDISSESFELYSNQDYLGRSRVAIASLSVDLMPTEERKGIGSIKPTGFHSVKYDIVDGKYLYNRCHLIGFQLAGESKTKENLITCTRQMNTEGMLQFENKVAQYIKDTKNHVMYRVTPMYEGNNLLASGVQIEALSVEDNGKGIKFNVYVYNVQDGININYQDGSSSLK